MKIGDIVKVINLTPDDETIGGYKLWECFEIIGKAKARDGTKLFTKKYSGCWLRETQLKKVNEKIRIGDTVRVIKLDKEDKKYNHYEIGEIFVVDEKHRNYTNKNIYAKKGFHGLYKAQIEKVND